MILRDYLASNKIKLKDFAVTIGTSTKYLSAVLNGRRGLGKEWAKKIEGITGGKCSRMELLYPEEYTETDDKGGKQMKFCPNSPVDINK